MNEYKSVVRVVAAIIEFNGKFLACRRASHKVSAGLWEFPGGKVEDGESAETALLREIREELDIEIRIHGPFDISTTRTDAGFIQLECFSCTTDQLPTGSGDHDLIWSVGFEELALLNWAKPDLPAVHKLINLKNRI